MLKIRLSMGGAKKRPIYKIVIADSRFPRDGRFIEKLGFFNPLLPKTKKERVTLEVERIKHWISKGAKPTLRVSRILGEAEVLPMPSKGNNPLKAIPKKDRKKDKSEDEKTVADGVKLEPKKEEPKKEINKKYNSALWISLPDFPGKLGEVTSLIGINKGNITSVEMIEKKADHINFMFDIQIDDLKNFTKLISELKQKEFNFRIIRHKKKHALLQRLFKSFKKN